MDTLTLRNGYDRRKNPEMLTFRRATMADVGQAIHPGARLWFQANDGSARQLTIASQIKRWQKPSATRNYTIEFAVKYGLREWDRWRNCGCADDDLGRLLIPEYVGKTR